MTTSRRRIRAAILLASFALTCTSFLAFGQGTSLAGGHWIGTEQEEQAEWNTTLHPWTGKCTNESGASTTGAFVWTPACGWGYNAYWLWNRDSIWLTRFHTLQTIDKFRVIMRGVSCGGAAPRISVKLTDDYGNVAVKMRGVDVTSSSWALYYSDNSLYTGPDGAGIGADKWRTMSISLNNQDYSCGGGGLHVDRVQFHSTSDTGDGVAFTH